MTKKTWAQEREEELSAKGKENWDEDDYEAYYYIQECYAEDERDAEYLDHFSMFY